jgi:hypothetical protein
MSHGNARTTFQGRLLIVQCHREGWPQSHIAMAMGISRQCVKKWLDRFASAGEEGLELEEAVFRGDAGVPAGVELAGTGSLTSRLWAKPALVVTGIDAPGTRWRPIASNRWRGPG